MNYIHVGYYRDIKDLSDFLKNLHPEELISVTQKNGYTVIWKSNRMYDWR